MCQFISVVNIADVAEDKNSILTQIRCCHLSDPVLSVRPGSKCPNTQRDISWLSVILVEETGVPGETPPLSQVTVKLYNIKLYRVHLNTNEIRTHKVSDDRY